jgi:hypothetical protein
MQLFFQIRVCLSQSQVAKNGFLSLIQMCSHTMIKFWGHLHLEEENQNLN